MQTNVLYGIGDIRYTEVPDAQENRDGFERWISDRTDGIGADIVFECVGRNETVVQAIDGAGPMGRVVLVGNPSADMQFSRDMYWKILRNQLTVIGTWNSSYTGEETDDWHCVRRLLAEGKIKPEKSQVQICV